MRPDSLRHAIPRSAPVRLDTAKATDTDGMLRSELPTPARPARPSRRHPARGAGEGARRGPGRQWPTDPESRR